MKDRHVISKILAGLSLGLFIAAAPCYSATSSGASALRRANAPRGPGSISGVWEVEGYVPSRVPSAQRRLRDANGAPPPLLPWAQELYDKRARDSDAAMPFASTTAYCLPGGMPQMMFGATFPIQILETPGQVTMIFEEQHSFRLIYLNKRHPPLDELDPGFWGDSVGHWDGDTLVVDTVGLSDRLTMDILGLPQSQAMHVVERIRRISPTHLENILTIDDPKVASRPWTIRKTYQVSPRGKVGEYICENNRNAPRAGGALTVDPVSAGPAH